MSTLGRARNWLLATAMRSNAEHEMRTEMALHIAQAAERFRRRGLSEREALLAARREFGNVGALQEEARDVRGGRWLEVLSRDVQHALRYFRRTPLTSATIVLVLMVGIGVNAAVFSIAMSTRRPPPGVSADAPLVVVRGLSVLPRKTIDRQLSYAEIKAYRQLANQFESFAAMTSTNVVLDTGDDESGVTTASATFVTPNYFQVLGNTLDAGTGFVQSANDETADPDLSVIVTHAFAVAHFGTPQSAVGQHLRLNDVIVVINGVAAAPFRGLYRVREKDAFWLPVSAWRVVGNPNRNIFQSIDSIRFGAVARLRDGVTVDEASKAVQLAAIRAGARLDPGGQLQFEEQQSVGAGSTGRRGSAPLHASGVPIVKSDVVRLVGETQIEAQRMVVSELYALSLIVILLLLVCATTVSSLLVGAAVNRRGEIAVRLALGASRLRIIRQLLTESVILAIAGGSLGIAVLATGWRVFKSQISFDIEPRWGTAVFMAFFAILTAVLCGLSPALHATRIALSDVLKDSTRGSTARSRLQRFFVIAGVALTQPLLVGLALTIVQLHAFGAKPAAVVSEHLIVAEFDSWSGRTGKQDAAMRDVMRRLSSLPGVTTVLPLDGWTAMTLNTVESPVAGRAPFQPRTMNLQVAYVPADYFRTIEVPMLYGREFRSGDNPLVTVTPTIVTAGFAREFFGTSNVVGRRLTGGEGSHASDFEIVGVVAGDSVHLGDLSSPARVFIPHAELQAFMGKFLIRTSTDGAALIPAIRKTARIEAPMIPIRRMQTIAQADNELRHVLLRATSASATGGMIILLLAAIGLCAMVALNISQRRREIGIRVAMGARPSQVVAMFFGRGVKLSVIGLLVGLPLSAAAVQAASQRPGAPQVHILAIAAAIASCVIVVASLASWMPARRAAHVDPLTALRAE